MKAILAAVLPALAFAAPVDVNADPNIQAVLSKVDTSFQHDFLETLTNFYKTRQTHSDDATSASEFCEGMFSEWGFDSSLHYHEPGMNPNVIAEKKGTVNPEKVVILGAHLDDRARGLLNPNERAPGANDDGSGTALVVELARLVWEYDLSFDYTVRFALWGGEEQGLFGSKAYSAEMKAKNEDIVVMLQSDMVGYLTPGDAPGVELSVVYATTEVTDHCLDLVETYVPGLRQLRGSACCSDQQPFFADGFPAGVFNEPGGYVIDPEYHQEGDVVDRPGYNFEQLGMITQAVAAAMCDYAGLNNTPF